MAPIIIARDENNANELLIFTYSFFFAGFKFTYSAYDRKSLGAPAKYQSRANQKGVTRDVPGGPGGGSSSAAPRPLDGDFSICGGGPASRCPPSPLTAAQQRRRRRPPRWNPGAAAVRDNRGRLRALLRGRLWLMRTPPGCSSGRGCESSAPALPIQSQCDARRCDGCSAWGREGWRGSGRR